MTTDRVSLVKDVVARLEDFPDPLWEETIVLCQDTIHFVASQTMAGKKRYATIVRKSSGGVCGEVPKP